MELLIWSLFAFLAVLGLVDLIRMGIFWLLRPSKPENGALVVIPTNGEDCEQLVRGAAARLRWLEWENCKLLCLNRNEDPQIEVVCKILERRYPNLRLCKRENLVYHMMEEDK